MVKVLHTDSKNVRWQQCGQHDRLVLLSLYSTAGPLQSPNSSVESLPKTISTYESPKHNTQQHLKLKYLRKC